MGLEWVRRGLKLIHFLLLFYGDETMLVCKIYMYSLVPNRRGGWNKRGGWKNLRNIISGWGGIAVGGWK